jgi:hypothetical protein
MYAIWNEAGEATTLVVEVLMGEVHPLKTLTALTVFITVMVYSIQRTMTLRQLIALWVLESTTLVLWTVCLVVLHYVGLA